MSAGELLRVAVASATGNVVDSHFATSPFFHIYDFDGAGWTLVESRGNPDGSCACGEGLHEHSFEPINDLISDCRFVIASQIGPAAAISLFRYGIRAHVAIGFVEEALRSFQSTSKFQHPLPRKAQATP